MTDNNNIPDKATQRQRQLEKEYLAKIDRDGDFSPAAQAARMANALYQARQRDKNNNKGSTP